MMFEFLIALVQALLVVLLAPLVSGISRVMRAKIQSRKGPGLLQDYRDLGKLFKRPDLRSKYAGSVFRYMPVIFISSILVIAMALPMITRFSPIPGIGDMILVVYLLALSRFIFVAGALDSASAFAGAGGIRELIISTLIESAMLMSLLVLALITGSTDIGTIATQISSGNFSGIIAVSLAAIAFAFTIYVELGKLPFDLAEAEQELQEGPLTEYSGPSFALIKIGLGCKQIVVISWFVALFIPYGAASDLSLLALLVGLVVWLVKILLIFSIVAVLENIVARVRFKLLSRQSWFVVGISVLAFVFYVVGL